MNYIGIDNGVSGSIGIITPEEYFFMKTPVYTEQDYVGKKQKITLINFEKLCELFEAFPESRVLIERPLKNPGMFKATISAMRAFEATMIALKLYKLPYEVEDSKKWQRILLPKGTKGTAELKRASLEKGSQLYPKYADLFKKHKDADGMLIAHYYTLKYKIT